MNTVLNKNLLETTRFSTNTLSPFSFYVHKLQKTGAFVIEIYSNNQLAATNQVIVSKENPLPAVNIDLALPALKNMKEAILLNEQSAYLLFYNSQGFSMNRIVIKENGNAIFDSNKPEKGDLFVLNLLKPGEYTLDSKSLKTSLKINIEYPSLTKTDVSKTFAKIKLNANSVLKNDSQSALPNQGIIFELGDGFTDFEIAYTKSFDVKLENSIQKELKNLARASSKVGKKEFQKFSLKR